MNIRDRPARKHSLMPRVGHGAPGGGLRLVQRPGAAAWYCSITLAGIRPRSLTVMPWSLAHARTSPLRCRPAEVRAVPRPSAARLAGVLDERRELLAEGTGVRGAQVDLAVGAAEPEPHCLICRAAIQIVFQRDGDLLSHLLPPMPTVGIAAPSPAVIPHTSCNGADHTPFPGTNRRAARDVAASQRRPRGQARPTSRPVPQPGHAPRALGRRALDCISGHPSD